MERCAVCPLTTVTAPLAVPATARPAQAVALTVWTPIGTLSVPENVPPGSRARSAETPAGATCTETRVICALRTCAATETSRSAYSAAGRDPQAQIQSATKAQRIVSGRREHD